MDRMNDMDRQILSAPPAAPAFAGGPNPCCAEYSIVTHCDSVTDTYRCGICGAVWIDRCPDADLWRPE